VTDYRLEKSRRRIVVKMHSGEMLTGDMFLQPYGRYGGGAERPIDILNAAERFFPLKNRESGEIVLVAKDQVVSVACDRDPGDDDSRTDITRHVALEVRLIHGDTFAGTALLEVPEDHARVLDFLNRWKPRFIPLHTGDGQLLVNRSMIERVRSLDRA
jgi:hypothetical protein